PAVIPPKSNVLVFMEWGESVKKYATGQYHEELRFSPGSSPVRGATVKVQSQNVQVLPYDDLYFQATTRGGRVMDHILANKAVFKSTTDTIGNAALVSGGVLAATQQGRHNSGDEVGLGLLAFGLVSKIVSATTTPTADIRSWENLPQFISFTGLVMSPGENILTVEFNDSYGRPITSLTKTLTINVPPSGDKVVFVSDHSPASQRL
ncbi:MAG: hypothetical protein JWM04_192, partial [Verrucomicrobiales bacterium]|nr:hypothetical protein [Verrucomicrobiales bacterium]